MIKSVTWTLGIVMGLVLGYSVWGGKTTTYSISPTQPDFVRVIPAEGQMCMQVIVDCSNQVPGCTKQLSSGCDSERICKEVCHSNKAKSKKKKK